MLALSMVYIKDQFLTCISRSLVKYDWKLAARVDCVVIPTRTSSSYMQETWRRQLSLTKVERLDFR